MTRIVKGISRNGFISEYKFEYSLQLFACIRLHDSIVVSIPACHAGDRGSIPRRGVSFISTLLSSV